MPKGVPLERRMADSISHTSVSISRELLAKLKLRAAEEAERRGKKRISVRDLVEEAVEEKWFGGAQDTQTVAATAPAPARHNYDEEYPTIFPQLLARAFGDESAELAGGTYYHDTTQEEGPQYYASWADLAAHLRSALDAGRAICTLDELVVDYTAQHMCRKEHGLCFQSI